MTLVRRKHRRSPLRGPSDPPLKPLRPLPDFLNAPKFWSRVDRSGGPDACWPWMAARHPSGHGIYTVEGRQYGAHRVAYQLTHGRLADGLFTLHRPECNHGWCCNPAHLYGGTLRDNRRDVERKLWGEYPA